MTPGIKVVEKAKVEHQVLQYDHDVSAESYGLEASEKLGLDQTRVFKTLVVSLDNQELVVGVLPVSAMLSMKLIAKAFKGKKASMAEPKAVERATGYVLGGVSPVGQKKRLKTVIDASAQGHDTIYVSAGRRGLEIELKPADLVNLVNGTFADICQAN